VYHIKAAVAMFSKLFQAHRSSSSAIMYATRAVYNMALWYVQGCLVAAAVRCCHTFNVVQQHC
jgi:hypothetical protein